jgi:AraC-like DNA-binding protein/mannose-6-phosphate isomerase-like protein (cupin superfamily)
MTTLPAITHELLGFLTAQPHEVFGLAGRIDSRRYLARSFPEEMPLLLCHQRYPGYRRMIGENWMHWHDYYECFLALSGHGEFQAGTDRFFFSPGDIVVVDPLKIHGVIGMEAAHTALVILFPAHLVTPAPSRLDQGFLAAWDQRRPTILPVLRAGEKGTQEVHQALLDLTHLWFGENRSGHALGMKLHFLRLCFHLGQALGSGSTAATASHDRPQREQRLRRALDHIALHAHEPLTQPAVARAAGMSTSRFRQFFKDTTGWGFARYLRELRVERAAKLLRDTDDSIATIAHMTGFADQSHLMRCFKAKHGAAPLAYRRRHQDQVPG